MVRVARNVHDRRLLKLIGRYPRAGVMVERELQRSIEGTRQGGPLSPLLANILLDDFDKELEHRGLHFVRYADDFLVFTKTREAATRVAVSIEHYLTHKPKLVINHQKSRVCRKEGVEFLGFAFIGWGGQIRVSPKNEQKFRDRHDVVATWSDDDVARKWWMLCPARKDKDGSPAEPTEFELNSIRNDKTGLKEKRVRLSSVSWFMRFLSERVAKEANKQDQCSGRFWEGRFKSQVLLDDAAILACLQYVDLNPVRAGIAVTPESSDFTSAQDRIVDAFSKCSVGSFQCSEDAEGLADGDRRGTMDNRVEHGERAGWLAPIELREECSVGAVRCSESHKERESQMTGENAGNFGTSREVLPRRQCVPNHKILPGRQDLQRRASNKGCLAIGLGDYLQLVDWTGRQIRSDKRGAMPANLEPLFERLGISTETWVDCVVNFRKWFRSSVGRPKSMEAAAESRGHNRAISINSARKIFTSSEAIRQPS